ncbi:MAG TPA: ATP-binding protein [Bryobacteraceae bacterium]|nr:ATP-binding protein [Bryobacteraceae bacterium]
MSKNQRPTAILVNVDDHEPTRYARQRVLEGAGFVVHSAGTGVGALRLVDDRSPDLVLLDVHLPDVDGIEVCRRIKNSAASAAVLVLQISASAISAPQATAALNMGADAYLVEPVDPDVLVATVRSLLRLRAAERGLAQANVELAEKNAELLRVNHALRRSNEDLERFAYIGSHDLQEPLRNITTHIQLLERLTAERFNESERHLFAVVLEGAQRMAGLIQDVLAYSGIGREQPELKPTALADALAMATGNLSEGIAAAGAEVTAGPLPAVLGDTPQLGRVFQNLIGNSLKYRSDGVPLRVNITSDMDPTGDCLIRVADNGIGIAANHLDRVFEPFKRLHGHDIPGNGIGLALCRRIIEGHGGRIWAESGEGQGAVFLFTLHPAR